MRTHQAFSRVRKDAKGKESEVTNEGGCFELEELSRRKQT